MRPRGELEKPSHGAPCNGCGQCCMAETCTLGYHVFKTLNGPCPALEPGEAGAYRCGLIEHPDRYVPLLAFKTGRDVLSKDATLLIGSGFGCDAQYFNEPRSEAFDARLAQYRRSA